MPIGATVKKHQIAIFLDMAGKYKRIKKSTTLELGVEAETETQDYIADPAPTEELKNYKVTLPQDLSMIKGEDDFEFVWEHFYKDIAKGNQTKCKALIVFMFDGDKTAGYKAWETDASLIFENLNGVDSKINFNINFGGQIRTGLAKPSEDQTPTFEEQE